jgi:hypothetical protein
MVNAVVPSIMLSDIEFTPKLFLDKDYKYMGI